MARAGPTAARDTIAAHGADETDALGDAGNIKHAFLNGTILHSPAEAIIEVSNPYQRNRLTLDFSDERHPKRTDESGAVEHAAANSEVWVDFEWKGPQAGDAYRPFATLKAAVDTVMAGGAVRLVPGETAEKVVISKRPLRILAPLGGVAIGTRTPRRVVDPDPTIGAVDNRSVWVQFDSPDPNTKYPSRPFNTIKAAVAVVAEGGEINVQPGATRERLTISKRLSIVAPIGGVAIGAR